MERYFIIIEGKVQGVGFRYFCQMQAMKLSLTGSARNMNNGMVHVEVQGEVQSLDKFLAALHKGNGFCRVDDYSIKKLPLNLDEKKFRISY